MTRTRLPRQGYLNVVLETSKLQYVFLIEWELGEVSRLEDSDWCPRRLAREMGSVDVPHHVGSLFWYFLWGADDLMTALTSRIIA